MNEDQWEYLFNECIYREVHMPSTVEPKSEKVVDMLRFLSNPAPYVLGFAFKYDREPHPSVCLIEKTHPEWQNGLLNGIGGRCEEDETPVQAMEREFTEETGLHVAQIDWLKFFVMRFRNGAIVHCFTTRLAPDDVPRTMEIERVEMYETGFHGKWFRNVPIVPNLNWLIPMAFHELTVLPGQRMVVE